jgi:general secretion pathway protein I
MKRGARGFTLVEVLVALMVIALGLAALMVSVSGAARTSGYLREKSLAQWIALNRIVEVRLNLNKFAQNTDTGELDFANRHWHYDTRYFDTSVSSMRRIVVRVWAGNADTKGNPLAEAIGFLGTALSPPGNSNQVSWTADSQPTVGQPGVGGLTPGLGTPAITNPATTNPAIGTPITGAAPAN